MASNLDAGVGQHAIVTNPTGHAGSITQNPLPPVEDGNNSAKSAYTTVNSTAPLGDPNFGGVATAALTGTVSTKGDGDQTGVATTSYGSGSGATVTYTVASNVASGLTIVSGGTNYGAGEQLFVTGDPGVTLTVSTVA